MSWLLLCEGCGGGTKGMGECVINSNGGGSGVVLIVLILAVLLFYFMIRRALWNDKEEAEK